MEADLEAVLGDAGPTLPESLNIVQVSTLKIVIIAVRTAGTLAPASLDILRDWKDIFSSGVAEPSNFGSLKRASTPYGVATYVTATNIDVTMHTATRLLWDGGGGGEVDVISVVSRYCKYYFLFLLIFCGQQKLITQKLFQNVLL